LTEKDGERLLELCTKSCGVLVAWEPSAPEILIEAPETAPLTALFWSRDKMFWSVADSFSTNPDAPEAVCASSKLLFDSIFLVFELLSVSISEFVNTHL
jgi:hypothetical protein